MPDQNPDELIGSYGAARRIPPANYAAGPSIATLDAWIITAPGWHPHWSQYQLAVISLADFPGVPPAKLQRPGVTHELMVMTLNPEHGPYHAEQVRAGAVHILTPVNIAEQFTATDEQAQELAGLCARAVVDGVLRPETAEAPERIRASWRASIHQTLDHHRDPHHGTAN